MVCLVRLYGKDSLERGMDYKYIEQLLDRYWECQTTLEEEAILRSFFAQFDIPASLLPYRDLFVTEEKMSHEHLSEDFDNRLMARLNVSLKKADVETKIIPITQRLAPLWRAAAIVAVVLTIGMAAQQGFQREKMGYMDSNIASVSAGNDTIQLFTDQPQLSPKTEAVLSTNSSDSIGAISKQ